MLNNINMIGRLPRDPELKKTSSGKNVCNFTIAWEDHFKGEKTTHYIDCTAWNAIAENVCKYCAKGSQVRVGGRLKTRTYENSAGTSVKVVYIECSEVDFLTPQKTSKKDPVDFTKEFEEAEKKFEIKEEDIQF